MADDKGLDMSEKLVLLIKVFREERFICTSTRLSCLHPQLCVEVDWDAKNMMNRSHTKIELVLCEQVLNVCNRSRSNILGFKADEDSNLRRILFAKLNCFTVVSVKRGMQIVWSKMFLRDKYWTRASLPLLDRSLQASPVACAP